MYTYFYFIIFIELKKNCSFRANESEKIFNFFMLILISQKKNLMLILQLFNNTKKLSINNEFHVFLKCNFEKKTIFITKQFQNYQ